MSRFSLFTESTHEESRGVSAVIGVLILVVLTLLLVSGVYFTASNLTTNQPQDISAGTTTERISPYEYQTTLITNGNADNIQVTTPLGTTYNLSEVGDYTNILAVQSSSSSQVSQLQIKGVNSNGQEQLLKSQTVDNGINPDLIVDKHGTGDYTSIQTAINNAPSATASNPAIIVVEKATYTENIDVSQNITLIAEHGTVIQDAAPNEPVVHIQGDDSQLRNFQVNGDPKANDGHYASHGVLVDGSNAQLVGNTITHAQSPDLNSAGIAINSENAFIQYNNFNSNERSINLQSNAESPLVCGNQLSNSIGGFVSDQTKRDLAMNNYWQNGIGIPTNLVPDRVSSQVSASDLTERQSLSAASSRVPVSMLPDNSRAAQPFPGTQLSSNSQGASIQGCDVNVNFVNLGLTFSLSDIRVLVNGETPLAVYSSADRPSTSGQELANEQGERVAVCSCGGDGSYDDGDVITIYKPSSSSSSSSTGDSSDYSSGSATFPQNPAADTEYTVVETSSSGGSTSYTPVDENSVEQVASVSPPQDTSTEETDNSQSSDLNVELGDKITAQVGDELVLAPVLNGSADNASYQWNFDDGTTASTKQVEHIYTNTGTYNVSLTVNQPNTSETATDSVTIEITESTSSGSFDTVSSTSELQAIVTDSSSTGSNTVYLSNGTYSITSVSNPDLTVVGTGDGVVFENRVSVSSSGVTLRNVELQDGVSVSAGEFKLYNADVSSDNEYSVEVSTSGSDVYIGSSSITGVNGVFVEASGDVIVKDNSIDVSGSEAVSLSSRMDNVEVSQNTLTATDYGVFVGHATAATVSNNDITASDEVYEVPNQKPSVNSVNVDSTLSNVQSVFDASVSDPQGDAIESVEWEVDGVSETLSRGESFEYVFGSTGEFTVEVTVTDEFGASTTTTKTVTVTQPQVSVSTASPVSVGDTVTASMEMNIPQGKIDSIEYAWGSGDVTSSNSYSYSSTGSYTITASVTTVTGSQFTAATSLDVVNTPVARFDVSDVLVNKPVSFDASSSSAPNNGQLTYQWTIDGASISEAIKTGESISYTFPSFGDYSVNLKVTGPDGYTDSISRTITVDDMTVSFSVDNPGVNVDSTLSVSTSGGSAVDEYRVDWDGDGSFDDTYYTSSISHSFASTGEREITVKAIDTTSGSASTTQKSVNVYSSPSFDLYAETTNGKTTLEYTFEARNVNADGPSYEWSFGNGDMKTGQSVTQMWEETGTYNVQVVVENKYGITRSKSTEVVIEYLDPYRGCKEFDSDTTLQAGTYNYECVVITAGTTVTAQGDPAIDMNGGYGGVKFDTTGPIVINGTLNADYQGYPSSNYDGGPGQSYYAGGYGDHGCRSPSSFGCYYGEPYGSPHQATRLGSTSNSYSNGGGSVWLVSDEYVYVNGKITANGLGELAGGDASAGSGGSIRIEAPVTKGNGVLQAEGGSANDGYNVVSGAGGRILIDSPNRIYSWSISVSGGYPSHGNGGSLVEK